jgi:hypothetical protein
MAYNNRLDALKRQLERGAPMIPATNETQERQCDYCGKTSLMRHNQKFCCSAHRSAYANMKMKEEIITLRNRVAELEKLNETDG